MLSVAKHLRSYRAIVALVHFSSLGAERPEILRHPLRFAQRQPQDKTSNPSIQQLNPAGDRLRCRGRGSAAVDDVREQEVRVGLLVGSEADDEVALRLRDIFEGVTPWIVQE